MSGDTYPAPEHGWVCFHCGAPGRSHAGPHQVNAEK